MKYDHVMIIYPPRADEGHMSDWVHLDAMCDIKLLTWRPTMFRKSAIVRFYREPDGGSVISADGLLITVRETFEQLVKLLGASDAFFDSDPQNLEPIGTLQLSVRASRCLEAGNIQTIGDLLRRGPDGLLEIRNFGETSLNEIYTVLDKRGLKFRGQR